MDYSNDRTWFEIDLDVIRANYNNIKNSLKSGCEIMGVVKANAYGIGSIRVAQLFEEIGCPIVAVATVDEAVSLRDNGVSIPILILGPINPKQAPLAIEGQFHVSIVSGRQAEELSNICETIGRPLISHIKIDSGLTRLGIVVKEREEEAFEEVRKILSLKGLEVCGIFTHTTNLSVGGRNELEEKELKLFAKMVALARDLKPNLKAHCLSSSTLQHFPEYSYDYVRIGALYMGMTPEKGRFFNISQAVNLKSRIIQVKEVGKGASVSYDATYITKRPTTIAIIPIGFADGLRRSLSNRGHVLLHGKEAPIIGKICCDYTILDVTDIPSAAEGDVVTILGKDNNKEQYVYQFAELYPASISEVTASFTSRIPRYYIKNRKISI